MKKAIVIINEQHALFPQQEQLLRKYYGGSWEPLKVPARGWTLREQAEVAAQLTLTCFGLCGDWPAWKLVGATGGDAPPCEAPDNPTDVIFASPVPALYGALAATAGESRIVFKDETLAPRVLVFHNDQREKVELPNGRVIQRIAREGWVLVDVTTGQVLD